MKIVDRKTFLALPPDTLFAKYAPCYVEELQIKGESIGEIDFLCQDIALAVDSHNCGEMTDMLEAAQHEGASVPLNFDCLGRDGCFDQGQLFAVYESRDVEALIARLQRCLAPQGVPEHE